MLKISDLQSQIALNSQIIFELEFQVHMTKIDVDFLKHQKQRYPQDKDIINGDISHAYDAIGFYKKKIKQYAKLQRALKDELAYRIRYSRVMREVEAITEKAKTEGWEVVIVDDNKYDEMLKGE